MIEESSTWAMCEVCGCIWNLATSLLCPDAVAAARAAARGEDNGHE